MGNDGSIGYYAVLLFVILIGAVVTTIAGARVKFDFPEDKLKLMQKKCKKRMIIFFVTMLLSLTTIIPLYVFSPKHFLLIQFFILFFSIIFTFLFIRYLQIYWLIVEKLQQLSQYMPSTNTAPAATVIEIVWCRRAGLLHIVS